MASEVGDGGKTHDSGVLVSPDASIRAGEEGSEDRVASSIQALHRPSECGCHARGGGGCVRSRRHGAAILPTYMRVVVWSARGARLRVGNTACTMTIIITCATLAGCRPDRCHRRSACGRPSSGSVVKGLCAPICVEHLVSGESCQRAAEVLVCGRRGCRACVAHAHGQHRRTVCAARCGRSSVGAVVGHPPGLHAGAVPRALVPGRPCARARPSLCSCHTLRFVCKRADLTRIARRVGNAPALLPSARLGVRRRRHD